jgi:hypothetical protein
MLDVDKMISVKNKSIREGDMRFQNMRMAVDLNGLKNTSLTRNTHAANLVREPEENRGTFQIFRLVRAAQLHYFQATRRLHNEEEDAVNTSFNQEE